MAENIMNTTLPPRTHRIRHYRGRFGQIRIFLMKLLRLFYYQNDWKVLPMSVLVAGLVAIVVRDTMYVTMEGTLIGSFSMACVALWNGCFNSIQSICRERDVIKREHRSGMHISSYIISHVIYQALLCLVQTILSLHVFRLLGLKIPAVGMFTSSMKVEVAVTMFLVTFAADMLSLLISSLVHTTTTAMTLMPFILIFQLVFSGGLFSLPAWANSLTALTLSGNGMKCIAAQADYNNLPMVAGWNNLFKMRREKITLRMTVGEILELLSRDENPTIHDLRSQETELGLTVGDFVDMLNEDPHLDRSRSITANATIGDIINLFGEEEVRNEIMSRTASASQVSAYEQTKANVAGYWAVLCLHSLVYVCLAVIVLEFIDKDKR